MDAEDKKETLMKVMATLAGSMEIEDVVMVMRAGLCEYRRRILAIGLMMPIGEHKDNCDHDHELDKDAVAVDEIVMQ